MSCIASRAVASHLRPSAYESFQRAQDPRPSAVESYRFERCVIQGCVIQAAPSSATTGMSCRLYKQQLQAVWRVTHTEPTQPVSTEEGQLSHTSAIDSLRHADITTTCRHHNDVQTSQRRYLHMHCRLCWCYNGHT